MSRTDLYKQKKNSSPYQDSSHLEPSEAVKEVPKTKIKKPPLYKVILLNDDFTPMEFVVNILKVIFHHNHSSATKIMMEVHHKGAGVAGIFTHEVAETKVYLVDKNAKERQYPLKCIMERNS